MRVSAPSSAFTLYAGYSQTILSRFPGNETQFNVQRSLFNRLFKRCATAANNRRNKLQNVALFFSRRVRLVARHWLRHVLPSVCPHVSARHLLDRFP